MEKLNMDDIKSKILNGQYKIVTKTGRSRSEVWSMFGEVEDESNNKINNIVCCKQCKLVKKFSGKQTTNLLRHTCFKRSKGIKVDSIEKVAVIDAYLAWSVQKNHPCTGVEDIGFLKMVEKLIDVGAKYGKNVNIMDLLPQSTIISKSTLGYAKVRYDVKS